jgi:hypothetical protein
MDRDTAAIEQMNVAVPPSSHSVVKQFRVCGLLSIGNGPYRALTVNPQRVL